MSQETTARERVLRVITESPGCTMDYYSKATGMHIETVRNTCRRLVKDSLIHRERSGGSNGPLLLYPSSKPDLSRSISPEHEFAPDLDSGAELLAHLEECLRDRDRLDVKIQDLRSSILGRLR